MATIHFERWAVTRTGYRQGGRGWGRSADYAAYMLRESWAHKAEDLIYAEAANLPGWAGGRPQAFFQAADTYERANGRIAEAWMMNFPQDIATEQRMAIVQDFLAARGVQVYPQLWVIHQLPTRDGAGQNTHSHVLVSARQPDGIPRSPEQFFLRYNADAPERGGCQKRQQLDVTPQRVWKERVAYHDIINWHAEAAGLPDRYNPYSFRHQGITRMPEHNLGQRPDPAALQAVLAARAEHRADRAAENARAAQYWDARKQTLGVTPGQSRETLVQQVRTQLETVTPRLSREALQAREHEATAQVQHYTHEGHRIQAALMGARHEAVVAHNRLALHLPHERQYDAGY